MKVVFWMKMKKEKRLNLPDRAMEDEKGLLLRHWRPQLPLSLCIVILSNMKRGHVLITCIWCHPILTGRDGLRPTRVECLICSGPSSVVHRRQSDSKESLHKHTTFYSFITLWMMSFIDIAAEKAKRRNVSDKNEYKYFCDSCAQLSIRTQKTSDALRYCLVVADSFQTQLTTLIGTPGKQRPVAGQGQTVISPWCDLDYGGRQFLHDPDETKWNATFNIRRNTMAGYQCWNATGKVSQLETLQY